ncbi:helix-turn-helix domain-containing protein [Yinghuangia sp. YIM S10712]|uniref:helix-turn-helix domain-containing protein n=1 Tax=Yinghuangia sp. YIM S10712 TaxID=3436930 RepID=UPI003F537FEC
MPHHTTAPSTAPVGLPAAPAADGDPTLVLLTVVEAARRLGVGRTTMYALIASGQITSVVIGRLRRVPAEALPAYVASLVADQALAA